MATWSIPKVAEVKVDVALNEDGNLAIGADTKAGTKSFTLKGFKVNGSPEQASTVLQKIITNIAGGSFDSSTAVYREEPRGVIE